MVENVAMDCPEEIFQIWSNFPTKNEEARAIYRDKLFCVILEQPMYNKLENILNGKV